MGPDDEAAAAELSSASVRQPAERSRRAPRDLRRPPRDDSNGPALPALASCTGGENGLDFEQVYKAHFAFVWRSLRLLGVPADAAEDAAQDTFDVVARQLASFEGRAELRTWLFAITQRVAANHRRSARRKLQPLQPLGELVSSDEPTPHAHAEAVDAALVVERFVAGLEPSWRAVFLLAVLEGLPGAQVAEALHLPINTVYSRVHTLRGELRRAFQRREAAT